MKRKLASTTLLLISFTLNAYRCSGKQSNKYQSTHITASQELYDSEKKAFLGDNPYYKSLKYFSEPYLLFEERMDSLEANFFSKEKDDLLLSVYQSLPKDYFRWNKSTVIEYFDNIQNSDDLKMRSLSFKTLVLHGFSIACKSASYEVNSIRPILLRENTDDKIYCKFILEAHNYLTPMIVTIAGDTLPYLKDYEAVPYLTKEKFNDLIAQGQSEAKVYYISWGDTNTFNLSIR